MKTWLFRRPGGAADSVKGGGVGSVRSALSALLSSFSGGAGGSSRSFADGAVAAGRSRTLEGATETTLMAWSAGRLTADAQSMPISLRLSKCCTMIEVHHLLGAIVATEKPRITLTLEPEWHDVLSRLASLQGRPMSKVIGELLHEIMPILTRLTSALEEVQRANVDAKLKFLEGADRAERELMPIVDAVRSQLDLFLAGVKEAGGDPACGVASASLAEPESPRPVITGAMNSTKGRKAGAGRGVKTLESASLRGK